MNSNFKIVRIMAKEKQKLKSKMVETYIISHNHINICIIHIKEQRF